MTETKPVPVGTLVRYHGSMGAYHGWAFVDYYDGSFRYTLRPFFYLAEDERDPADHAVAAVGSGALYSVRRGSFTVAEVDLPKPDANQKFRDAKPGLHQLMSQHSKTPYTYWKKTDDSWHLFLDNSWSPVPNSNGFPGKDMEFAS